MRTPPNVLNQRRKRRAMRYNRIEFIHADRGGEMETIVYGRGWWVACRMGRARRWLRVHSGFGVN